MRSLHVDAGGHRCAQGDVVLVEAGDFIPGDGEVIEGVASVDESAITGESAPVIRESGGDRSAVTGGTRVLSDWLVVRITANPGETFLDRMIAMVEGAKRQKTPNEIALNILLAALTIIFLLAASRCCRSRCTASDASRAGHADHRDGAGGPAGLPDPDDDRRPALGHRHRRHGPHDPGQRDRHVGPGGRGGRRRGRAAAGQDRHDHAGQPPGDGVSSRRRRVDRTSWPMPPSSPRWPTKRRKDAASSCWPRRSTACAGATCTSLGATLHSLHRADAHERRRTWTAGRSAKAPPTPSKLYVEAAGRPVSADGADQRSTKLPDRAARRWWWPTMAAARPGRHPLKDIVKGGIKERFAELRQMGIKTVMITGDNPLTAAAIAAEAGVDDFLAQATPEAKLKLIRELPGRRAPGGHDRRRHQRCAGPGPGRRGRGHEHRHAGRQRSRQHGRSGLATRPS